MHLANAGGHVVVGEHDSLGDAGGAGREREDADVVEGVDLGTVG